MPHTGIQDGSEQLLEWWNQVMELEEELNLARDALFLDKNNSTRSPTPITYHTSTIAPAINKTHHDERQWMLKVVNGRVQLETNIKDYQELLMYHQASIRYISPFTGLLQRENVRFDSISISAIASANLAFRYSRYQPQRQKIMMIEQQEQQLHQYSYRHEMEKLITIYMKTYNQIIGTLYEPSFMAHFNSLENPLCCPIALTTCIDAIAYLYSQLSYSSLEKRQWAEFFYSKYKEILFDMYHDPDCRLAVITTTTLVLKHLIDIVMDLAEARRMITMALLICNDLEENSLSRIDMILFRRHRTCLQLYDRCLNFYLEGKVDFSGVQIPDTELLEGESDYVEKYLMAWKSVIELFGSPYMTSLMQRVNLAIHGETCEISLDMILEFETILQEFWKSLPKIFKICDDPFTPTIEQVMNNIIDSISMIPFAALHCLSGIVQSSMLKPCFVNTDDSPISDNMARIIRDKAESMAIISIRALAYVTKRNLEIGVGSIPYCRSRRRKCLWELGQEKCERCLESGINCVPCERTSSNAGIQDGNKQLLEWWERTAELEETLDSIDHELYQSTKALTTRTSTNESMSGILDREDQKERQQRQPEWTLTVVNGRVRLESSIKNFEELIMYHQASIRYLSPLAGLLQRESLRFEGLSASVAIASTGLVIRYTHHTPRHIIVKELPYQFIDSYREEIDHLITLYMARYNACTGYLHERSFLDYYRRLKDPLTSPVVMAVCIDAIAYFYPQLRYTPLEKRQLAEFFYGQCRDMLLDMYGDPSRRMEIIMTSSFVMQYLQDVLMQYAEARRIVTVTLLICHDLDKDDEAQRKMSEIERVLLRRHYMSLRLWGRIIDIFLEGVFNFSNIEYCGGQVLEGESYAVPQYLCMWDYIVRFVGSPYITDIMKQISLAVHGEPYELSLDMVLHFEIELQEWWKSLPDYFQICDDPLTSTAYKALDTVTSSVVLLPFAVLHSTTALIQSALLKPPVIIGDNSSTATDDMIRVIREKAISLTLISIKVLVYIIKRNLEIDVEAIPLSIGYMMGTLHAVCSVVDNCEDIQLPAEVLDILFRCYTQINSLFPPGHSIPPSSSSLESFLATFKKNPIGLYYRFPMPGYAMISDVFHTCFNQLERGFRLAL
ncbi:hypothetical protein INT45_005052 [Circinella minor]|uniref:Uncharacterized protein n=1 Tax=Circinella minor TaxID=1195481 RepID=A0A8H7VKY5_9FUNG|nr:hypothetical protein INT45_005052 [Circinella minor]